jgi:hypothetical protein
MIYSANLARMHNVAEREKKFPSPHFFASLPMEKANFFPMGNFSILTADSESPRL